jgi:hypothetical protein
VAGSAESERCPHAAVDEVEQQDHAPDVGMIAEDTVTGGDDPSELVELPSPRGHRALVSET